MVKAMLEPLVKAMLFVDATPLPGTIAATRDSTTGFRRKAHAIARSLAARVGSDHALFRYPLSYMIYSVGFDGLPDYAHEYVYQRLADILSGRDQSPDLLPPLGRRPRDGPADPHQTKPAFAAFAQAHTTQTASAQPQPYSPTT